MLCMLPCVSDVLGLYKGSVGTEPLMGGELKFLVTSPPPAPAPPCMHFKMVVERYKIGKPVTSPPPQIHFKMVAQPIKIAKP